MINKTTHNQNIMNSKSIISSFTNQDYLKSLAVSFNDKTVVSFNDKTKEDLIAEGHSDAVYGRWELQSAETPMKAETPSKIDVMNSSQTRLKV